MNMISSYTAFLILGKVFIQLLLKICVFIVYIVMPFFIVFSIIH